MKGEKTLEILELISEAAIDMLDLVGVFLSAGYGASYGKIEYELDKQRNQRWERRAKREKQIEEQKGKNLLEEKLRQRFYEMIYRLKKDGLVEKIAGGNNKTFLGITPEGKRKLKNLKIRKENALPNYFYSASPGEKFVIIIFDIPENERKKRNWLREVLKNLGFKFIQKSVWLGKIKIPKEFVEDLRKLNLIEFVEIFEVSKTGSLRKIT
ncbi:MAG: CRISPR-associated endonuclease Cas2 [Patescibacteria group bacterium]